MGSYQIGVLKGDGIGPEVVGSAVAVMAAAVSDQAGLSFEWREFPMGWEAIQSVGNPLPDDTVNGLAECHGWILGADRF